MKSRALASCSVAGTLLLAAPATADFVSVAGTVRNRQSTGGASWDVYELYATFDSSQDQAVGVGGTPLAPQTLNAGPAGFLHATVFGTAHQNLPHHCPPYIVPNLGIDSMVSIGIRQCDPDAIYWPPVVEGFNLEAFNGGASVVTTTNGGWFIDPAATPSFALPFPPSLYDGQTPIGDPGTHGVMLGQFSVAEGQTFSGDLGRISVIENGVERIIDDTNGAVFSFSTLPGPGALGLLVVAGAWRRKRRG